MTKFAKAWAGKAAAACILAAITAAPVAASTDEFHFTYAPDQSAERTYGQIQEAALAYCSPKKSNLLRNRAARSQCAYDVASAIVRQIGDQELTRLHRRATVETALQTASN